MDTYALTDKALLQLIGKRLKEERLAQDISQSELAKRSGVSQPSICAIEKGSNASLLSIIALLRAMDKLDMLSELTKEKPLSPITYSEMIKKAQSRKRASHKTGRTEYAVASEPDFNWD